ncbi:uncharacterized protein BKCO1_1000451 [Diplodia corticola]|uniref:Cytochrome p450 protein n=1 Tax=Diplodia corticola TaxID=236234 RepID=A0A1J9RGP0_9PEZI|nr:uncharacterized protein BKCO1_1000451 [Diplodia corticola]OJD40710.1 hypothetical protein BKCO1_1000451 [Diplodia corticola]
MEANTESNSVTSHYEIFTGIWTNWSRGPVFGRTLTLPRRNGDLLIAFIALFVTIVGTSFWRILCFALHSLFSTDKTRDGIYHQRQAILRNSANGASGLVRFIQAMWAWRRRDSKPYRRIVPLITSTALFLCAFGVASGFSSRVSTGIGNEVLIQTPDFGIATGESLTYPQVLKILYPQNSRDVISSATYAQRCYTNDTNTASCNDYIKPRLDFQVWHNASCPFGPEMCKLVDENIFIDTGLLDFNNDFGVNLPPKRRFQYRHTTHCAPIVTEGYKQEFPETSTWWSRTGRNWTKPAYTLYYYGQAPFENTTNATYEYVTNVSDLTVKYNTAPAFYNIGTRQVYGVNGTIHPQSAFAPIPSLQRADADMVLIFLSANEIGYTAAVADPWYSANNLFGTTWVYGGNNTGESQFYYRDEPASVLGCVMQQQICNPREEAGSRRRCTPLSSNLDLQANAASVVQQGADEAWWLRRLVELLLAKPPALWDIINTIGSQSLSSSFTLYNGVQAPLPPDQWQRDVERWHSIMMASLQGSAVAVAEGPSAPELRAEYRRPVDERERALCRRQQLLCFRPLFIFAAGGLVIVASWVLEPFVAYVQRRCKLDSYARLEWCTNETLQLQRLAHEELGMGTWSKCDGDVPVTEKGERLAMLDLADSKHPKLKARPVGWEEITAQGPVGRTQEAKEDDR